MNMPRGIPTPSLVLVLMLLCGSKAGETVWIPASKVWELALVEQVAIDSAVEALVEGLDVFPGAKETSADDAFLELLDALIGEVDELEAVAETLRVGKIDALEGEAEELEELVGALSPPNVSVIAATNLIVVAASSSDCGTTVAVLGEPSVFIAAIGCITVAILGEPETVITFSPVLQSQSLLQQYSPVFGQF